jgi:ADP-heptose:LPS heptosyltransferase
MRELVALFHLGHLLISNDSGPPHFAALAKLKSITLFGPETPELYGPLNPANHNFYSGLQCSPCYSAFNQRQSPCKNNVCLQMISVEAVYDKALSMLAQ